MTTQITKNNQNDFSARNANSIKKILRQYGVVFTKVINNTDNRSFEVICSDDKSLIISNCRGLQSAGFIVKRHDTSFTIECFAKPTYL